MSRNRGAWTTKTPTEAGWWWYRESANEEPRIAEIPDIERGLVWWSGDDIGSELRDLRGEWQRVPDPVE